jgi:hypothetical protein
MPTSESRIWPTISVMLGALAWLPSRMAMPSDALDASWGAVLHEAARQSWQFGADLVFTYGPLGYLVVPTFAPDIFWWMVAFHIVVGAGCGWAFHALARNAGWPSWAGAAMLLALLPPTRGSSDIPFLLPVVLWPFLALQAPRPRAEPAALALSVVVGAVALVKFTTFMLAAGLACVLAADDLVRRRRLPVVSAMFLTAVLALWLMAGQTLSVLPAWLHTSFETSSAYSEAMSTPVGPYQRRELLLFAVNACALLGLATWRAVQQDGLRASALLLPASLLLVMFVQFKLGFVRHDAHATVAMFLMPVLGVLVATGGVPETARRRFRLLACVVVLLGLTSYAYGLRRYFDRLDPIEHYRAAYAFQIATVVDFARPAQMTTRLTHQRERALEALRTALPLPAGAGTIDLYGHRQGLLLAQALPYAPRPVFQSYGAYTPGLAELNRRFLASAQGPRRVLFDGGTIDHRYPLMDEALSLPVLLTQFDVRGVVDGFTLLERRATARSLAWAPQRQLSTTLDAAIAVESSEGPVWAEIDIEPTVGGRLLAMAYKLSPLYLEVTTADGAVRPHRIMRPLVRGGMLLSPLIGSSDEFVRLVQGGAITSAQRVTSVRVVADWPSTYRSRVGVRLSRLVVR